jgi:microcystin-dependent protein
MANRLSLVLSIVVGGFAIHGIIAACGSVMPGRPDAQAADSAGPHDIAVSSEQTLPSGTIVAFAGNTVPAGWSLCDGSAISRTAYALLFATVGISFGGGDGINTFNLPDLRGRSVLGAGQGLGLTDRILGQTLGEESHTLTLAEIPRHRHLIPNLKQYIPNRNGTSPGSFEDNDGAINTEHTDYQGGDGSHNNMQPNMVLNFIIKH